MRIQKLLAVLTLALPPAAHAADDHLLTALHSPILLQGNDTTAFRDPILAHIGPQFYLIYSYVRTEEDNLVYWYTAYSTRPISSTGARRTSSRLSRRTSTTPAPARSRASATIGFSRCKPSR